MACAYSMLIQNVLDEMVLVDLDQEKLLGEVMDLEQGIALCATDFEQGRYHGRWSWGRWGDCDRRGGSERRGISLRPGAEEPLRISASAYRQWWVDWGLPASLTCPLTLKKKTKCVIRSKPCGM